MSDTAADNPTPVPATGPAANPAIGEWAVVTGASSGLGADFARQLARRGYDVVLAARRVEKLEALAAEIAEETGRRTKVVGIDLTEAGSPERLFDAATADGRVVSVLVNNAGFGQFGQFLNRDPDEELELLTLNIATPVALTRLFGRPMAKRKRGHVLLLGSISGLLPTPWYAAYSASKGFIQNFAEALHVELGRKGIVVTVLSPGFTETEFFDVAGHSLGTKQLYPPMRSEDVVSAGLKGLFAGRAIVVPGWRYRLSLFLFRFVPRSMIAGIVGWLNMRSAK